MKPATTRLPLPSLGRWRGSFELSAAMTSPGIPVVELLRVSIQSQDSDERLGLDAQHSVNLATCARFGLSIVGEPIRVVVSGAEIVGSEAMDQLLDAISYGHAAGVVIAEYSRLFRPDRWDDYRILQTFVDHGALIYLPSGPIDLQTEGGFVMATVNNMLVSLERRRIKERFARGKEEHRRRGGHPNGAHQVPLGLSFSKEEGWSYTGDAERVREIFRRVLAGERNFGRLADEMKVSRTLLRLILRRSEYTGWRVYEKRVGGKYPNGRTRLVPRRPEDVIRIRLPLEPLISKEDFATVQAILSTRSGPSVYRVRGIDPFLYRGYLVCAADGRQLYVNASKAKDRSYYLCENHRKPASGVERCQLGYLRREVIKEHVDAALSGSLADEELLWGAVRAYEESLDAAWRTPNVDEGAVRRQLAELEQRRERTVESYLDGIISRTRRDQELAEITEKSATASALLKREPAAPAPSLGREDVAALALVLTEYAFLAREAKRLMLEALAPRIHVRKYEVVGVELPTHAFTSEAWLQKHAEQ
ncbi:MAG TPA: recombinase family protein [Longimicrobiaceae bacterium]|nr:recombinase family protein [Longimicrobiaceae bacterium]